MHVYTSSLTEGTFSWIHSRVHPYSLQGSFAIRGNQGQNHLNIISLEFKEYFDCAEVDLLMVFRNYFKATNRDQELHSPFPRLDKINFWLFLTDVSCVP